jgi:ribonuclease VapC
LTVCDTSALAVMVRGEPGAAAVAAEIATGAVLISSVNLAELASLLVRWQRSDREHILSTALNQVTLVPFDESQARTVADLYPMTAPHGLGLGDRACLALAMQRGEPVLTADRAWAELPSSVGVEVVVIR